MDARFAEGPGQQPADVNVLMIPEEIGGGGDHGVADSAVPSTVWYYGPVLSSLAYVAEFVLPQEPVIWGKGHPITEDRSLSVEPVRRFVTAQWSGIVDDDPFVVAVKCGQLLEWELPSWEFGYAGPAGPPPVSVVDLNESRQDGKAMGLVTMYCVRRRGHLCPAWVNDEH